jgi:ubiquinone/menaquinone biosynthesis C-methylase UbiE
MSRMTADHSPKDGNHAPGHGHDQGLKGMMKYLRFAREMWWSEINEATVARLAPQPGETVMDVGAGAGAGTMVAVKSGANVVAVEPTSYMRWVLWFRRLLLRVQDRVTVVDGSAESTGVKTGSIDAAWAVNTMHHWTNLEAGIAELARVLAPGGRALLVDEDFDDPSHPEYEKFGSKRREEHSHHFDAVDPGVVATELRRVGLAVRFAGADEIAGRPAIVIEASA